MNFVAQLEDYLRDLGAEARKNHPGVKEASERAILKLRTLQNQYATEVRKASERGEKHPSTTMFRSSDLLHPFLLAANYPNASPKLLDTSFKAMKTLMEANAICPGDGMNLVRVWMIQAQVVVSYSSKEATSQKNGSSSAAAVAASTLSSSSSIQSSGSESNAQSTSTGSWLGSFLSSSAKDTAKAAMTVASKAAVSSSHGQAGTGHLNAKDLEKLALDILSCLLQLLELRDLPVSTEQWIQSVTLVCLLYLPVRQTVRQAAHSTLPQVLTLLMKDENAKDLAAATWEDLLACSSGQGATGTRKKGLGNLTGAFSHCRKDDKDAPLPPLPTLSLDLMTTLVQEAPFVFSRVGRKSLGVVVQILQSKSNNASTTAVEYLRILQFVVVVLQTQAGEWPTECLELLSRVIQPVPQATEAIRKQADFEDGFVYSVHNKTLLPITSIIETLKGLPPTLLWKAALCIDTMKTIVNDKSLRSIWMDPSVLGHLVEAMSDFCTTASSCKDHIHLIVLACRKKDQSLAHATESLTSVELWKKGKTKDDTYILGEAVWAGANAILKIVEQLDQVALEQAFAASLAVLQHFLKRFPASGTIVNRALEGYFSLAKVSLKVPVIRQALLTSICKLSLPQWGTHDPTCLLRDHNVAALICLVNMIHRFYDSIGSEWSIALQTFQELSILPIASPHLSDSAYVGALSISAIYSRFAAFTTCLSDESLAHFVEGLRDVSQFDQNLNLISSPLGGNELLSVPSKSSDGSTKPEKGTIGKTIMSMGVRAIYGSSTDTPNIQHEDVPLAERTKNTYAHDYLFEFSRRVAASKHPMRVNQVPFTFSLLVDIAMANSYRSSSCRATMYRSLCGLASDVPSVRHFSMDAVAMLIMSQMANDDEFPTTFVGPGRIMYPEPRQNQYLAAERMQDNTSAPEEASQSALLAPLGECIQNAKTSAVAEAGVEALHAILESCGHDFDSDAWTTVIRAVTSLPSPERSSAEWSNPCLQGFRCLKLIVDDFVALTDPSTESRSALLDCCSSFGTSHHDLNTSLTAIGLLWTIADQDAGTDSIDRALSKLVVLCFDTRAEVRNCAVNTFFSCIAGRGNAFTDKQWSTCLCEMVFSVYDKVSEGVDEDGAEPAAPGKKSRYQVSVHHSRDSAGKQWVGTQALVLRGLCRVLRNFFPKLLESTDDGSGSSSREEQTPWFDDAWNKILGYAFDASTLSGGRDTLDVRTAGTELLVLCAQLSCKQGIQAAITPARVGTNMEVINGALRSVRSSGRSNGNSQEPLRHSHSQVTETWRENLFLDSFDVLDSFREHLDGDTANLQESGLHHTLEPTQVQVLSKFADEMGKLYECCKNDEFAEEKRFRDDEDFSKLLAIPRPKPGDSDPLVARFVQIVARVAVGSASSPDARFLSQAQRSCIEILRNMASDGSPEALLTLSELAGDAFFVQREGDGKAKKGVDILEHEASAVLEQEFSKESLSDDIRVLVTHRILVAFLDSLGSPEIAAAGSWYNLLVSFVSTGLESAKRLQGRIGSGSKAQLLSSLWEQVTTSLNRVLTPITDDSTSLITIPNSADLVDFVTVASNTVPPRRREEICTIIAQGCSKCLYVARENPSTRDDMLNLFTACFTGVCRMDPKNRTLHSLAEKVLSSSVVALKQPKGDPLEDIHVQACLMICQAIQQVEGVDMVLISVFSLLCQLIGTEVTEVRNAVGQVLARVDLGRVITESDEARLAAEERAVVAEIQVVELSKEVEKLRDEKESLERLLALG